MSNGPTPSLGNGKESTSSPRSAKSPAVRVVLLHQQQASLDDQLSRFLEAQLRDGGCSVYVDRNASMGMNWAREIEAHIRAADAVIPLLSAESVASETLGFEVETAREAARNRYGRPRLLPIRVNYTGPLPEPLAGILAPLPYQLWEGPQDDVGLTTELIYALQHLPPVEPATAIMPGKGVRPAPQPAPELVVRGPTPKVPPSRSIPLEPVGGPVPLNSEFYIVRSTDGELRQALLRYDSVILIKGARQMGKTSLLARGLQWARERGAQVASTDLQELGAADLENTSSLYLTLADSLADQLDLPVRPADVWDTRRSANVNFDRFLRREVLDRLRAPLVWGLDEVDRLLVTSYGSEVFGLFRSWHNQRALDPQGPWAGLTLVIAYATEAHLFISDVNQSPFNVGTRLTLDDFSSGQVEELNRRHGRPLESREELDRFVRLVGGHPYLVRRGLHELATRKIELGVLETKASTDEGIFGDHLRRILILLARDPDLMDVVRDALMGHPCTTPESFYRLRSAGVMSGNSPGEMRPRCHLYAAYLRQHLL